MSSPDCSVEGCSRAAVAELLEADADETARRCYACLVSELSLRGQP